MSVKYIHEEVSHNLNAALEIVPFIIQHFNPKSIIDVGCGIGTFLKVFLDNGVKDIIGIDGAWVDKSQLHIDKKFVLERDLEQRVVMHRKYDLVLCLEVAEHISHNAASTLVDSLTSLSDVIIFSAAVKNQGGQNHINEQNINYWIEKFSFNSFTFHDVFRDLFWENENIDWWYRQNMYLITRENIDITQFNLQHPSKKINQYIHPNALEFQVKKRENTKLKLNKVLDGQAPLKLYFNLLIKKLRKKVRI